MPSNKKEKDTGTEVKESKVKPKTPVDKPRPRKNNISSQRIPGPTKSAGNVKSKDENVPDEKVALPEVLDSQTTKDKKRINTTEGQSGGNAKSTSEKNYVSRKVEDTEATNAPSKGQEHLPPCSETSQKSVTRSKSKNPPKTESNSEDKNVSMQKTKKLIQQRNLKRKEVIISSKTKVHPLLPELGAFDIGKSRGNTEEERPKSGGRRFSTVTSDVDVKTKASWKLPENQIPIAPLAETESRRKNKVNKLQKTAVVETSVVEKYFQSEPSDSEKPTLGKGKRQSKLPKPITSAGLSRKLSIRKESEKKDQTVGDSETAESDSLDEGGETNRNRESELATIELRVQSKPLIKTESTQTESEDITDEESENLSSHSEIRQNVSKIKTPRKRSCSSSLLVVKEDDENGQESYVLKARAKKSKSNLGGSRNRIPKQAPLVVNKKLIAIKSNQVQSMDSLETVLSTQDKVIYLSDEMGEVSKCIYKVGQSFTRPIKSSRGKSASKNNLSKELSVDSLDGDADDEAESVENLALARGRETKKTESKKKIRNKSNVWKDQYEDEYLKERCEIKKNTRRDSARRIEKSRDPDHTSTEEVTPDVSEESVQAGREHSVRRRPKSASKSGVLPATGAVKEKIKIMKEMQTEASKKSAPVGKIVSKDIQRVSSPKIKKKLPQRLDKVGENVPVLSDSTDALSQDSLEKLAKRNKSSKLDLLSEDSLSEHSDMKEPEVVV